MHCTLKKSHFSKKIIEQLLKFYDHANVTDYPWSGSLRPVSGKLMKGGRRPDNDPGSSPWAGSLRHVDPNKKGKKMKKNKHDDGKLFSYATGY